MTFRAKDTKSHHKVRFNKRTMASSASSQAGSSASSKRGEPPSSKAAPGVLLKELSPDQEDSVDEEFWADPRHPLAMNTSTSSKIPSFFTTLPLIRDLHNTESSFAQDDVVQDCLPFLAGLSDEFPRYNEYGVPNLDRPRHVRFLHKFLQGLPAQFVTADAARPWFFYWVLCALSTLGEDVSPYRKRLVSTVRPMQNATGGFTSASGQISHLAPTYATVLALAIVGGDEALDLIDRKAMWHWLGALKGHDGGFRMSVGGEEDVR